MTAVLLCCALAVALQCRVYQLDTGLGQDELFTAVNYVELDSILDTISHNEVFNNHIGYSLMARLAEAIWGRSEFALRLPALLCGLLGRVADQEPGPDSRGHALHAAVIQVAGHGFDEGGLQAVHLPTLGRFTSFSQC